MLSLLQMDEVISELKNIWPGCTMVHGRPRHSESQGGVERLNRTAEDKLGFWMAENKSTQWSIGRLFARWQVNTQLSEAIGTTPYHLAFGQPPRCGLSSLPLGKDLLSELRTEADLQKVFNLDKEDAADVDYIIEEVQNAKVWDDTAEDDLEDEDARFSRCVESAKAKKKAQEEDRRRRREEEKERAELKKTQDSKAREDRREDWQEKKRKRERGCGSGGRGGC
jgi:hypothetical protein